MTALRKHFHFEMKDMDFAMKSLLMILMIVYLIMPVDLMPGPIDDAMVLLFGLLATNRCDLTE
ncbi:MAG: hypothetical protein MJ097_08100 [Dorea sp.]|nr:hypothetical protein [Dorea sp.]